MQPVAPRALLTASFNLEKDFKRGEKKKDKIGLIINFRREGALYSNISVTAHNNCELLTNSLPPNNLQRIREDRQSVLEVTAVTMVAYWSFCYHHNGAASNFPALS